MSDPTFQPGDLVQLKSGGPAMVVDRVYDSGTVACVWQNRQGEGTAYTYQPWVLETVPVAHLTPAEQYLQEAVAYVKRTMGAFTARTEDAKG